MITVREDDEDGAFLVIQWDDGKVKQNALYRRDSDSGKDAKWIALAEPLAE